MVMKAMTTKIAMRPAWTESTTACVAQGRVDVFLLDDASAAP